ncbi:hypothetical protein [Rathayibacter toxicus]|uniref:hypothetical protein n=2 Tax=Rathayibacter toxicus TaxID=145458 RepID=UPI0004176391|nr:hypothetical protein [Rathayibacter toxicus]QOD08292.1 hypothetical protein AYW78_10765 [Rathayibacter toxicus]QWL26954.1 hypothetical protein E2R32_10575 [Rathayibacter toxicus]QWL50008.1 hypothetical protein E2R43_10595 [Rathayibacter toxicus]QWL52061.1 hypothetical protein E2R44_10580 [Rathayibacter toxicus]QWL54407.1 hypothetical protein E2R45_10600 [Rathayibacter toxicus]
MKIGKKAIVFLTTAALAIVAAIPAQAETYSVSQMPYKLTSTATDIGNNLAIIATALKMGDDPRDTLVSDAQEKITYHLQNNINITFTYDKRGKVLLPQEGTLTPQVNTGMDPFPYISFDHEEQGPAISGYAGIVVTAICASSGFETAGFGCAVAGAVALAVVGVAAAHGICPGNQNLRVYPISMEGQCRND